MGRVFFSIKILLTSFSEKNLHVPMSFRQLSIFAILSIAIAGFAFIPEQNTAPVHRFHSEAEMNSIRTQRAPIDTGEYFLGSVRCQGCHGYDSLGISNIDGNGHDINLYDDWEATMMANSAKDPLWRAKVSHEILVNPNHAEELQDKCTSCHAPMGHYSAKFKGHTHYGLAELYNDTLGLNGVACGGCHQMGTNNLGYRFSGDIPYDTSHVEYGPFENPVIGPMQLYVGLIPTFSTHMDNSQMCSPCHTLITATADLNGNSTGNHFVEQATYHEWLNSTYSADNIVCQRCHMPQVTDSVIIANEYQFLAPRAPFNKHTFEGANEFMLKLMKNNRTALGITASAANYDSSIAVTRHLLQNNTLGCNLFFDSIANGTAYFRVRLTNRAGHKFPSGYPSRRAVVQFVLTSGSGDTIFRSGVLNSNYEVQGLTGPYEPHHNVINSESQAQIYEMVMGDVNGNKTTVLERGNSFLKDNRLVPEGFSTSHYAYDTVPIVGDAATDPDFNYQNGSEGTGRDFIHYQIPLNNFSGSLNASVKVLYQTLPPGWLTEMFTFNSTEIDSFKSMFNAADKTPVLVAYDDLSGITISNSGKVEASVSCNVFPNPANGEVTVTSTNSKINAVTVFSMKGEIVYSEKYGNPKQTLNLNLSNSGTFLIRIETTRGVVSRKIVNY
jgi:hypothetical protein